MAHSQLLLSALFEKREDHLHANSLDTVDQSILSHSILYLAPPDHHNIFFRARQMRRQDYGLWTP
jgi:hypothetical protein